MRWVRSCGCQRAHQGGGTYALPESLQPHDEVVPQGVALVLVDKAQDDALEALGRLGVVLSRLNVLLLLKVEVGDGRVDEVSLRRGLPRVNVRS